MSFFQKLTGSFKIQDDEEKDDGILRDDSPLKNPIEMDDEEINNSSQNNNMSNQTAPIEPEESPETQEQSSDYENDEMLSPEEGEDDEQNETGTVSALNQTDDEEAGDDSIGEDMPDNEEESLDEPEGEDAETPHQNTYTIAQLAKATSKKSSPKRRIALPSLKVRQEKAPQESKTPEGQLAIDVYETPDEIVIKSPIAGVKPQDLDVGIEDSSVNIRGSRHDEEKIKAEDYFYQECYWGTFSRSIILPVEVDSDKAAATLKDGILTVRLPKIKKEKEKK